MIKVYILFIILEIVLIYFFSSIANKIGLLDHPNSRKLHKGSVPLVGGVAIYSCLFLYFIFFDTSYFSKVIFISSIFIFLMGLYDDISDLGVAERIFFQTFITLLIIGFGIRIYDLGYFSIGTYEIILELGGFGVILTVLCIIGYSNAINFSDGLDGLAGGYLINCFTSIIIFSYIFGNYADLEILYLIVVLLIIFTFSNFGFFLPKIFLGDNGSTSLGFLASCYLVYFTLPDVRYFHPILTLWAAPIPIFDFIIVFTFRVLKKKSPFQPDRNHLHYMLSNSSIPQKYISIVLVLSSILLSIIGLITFIYFGSLSSLILFVFILLIFSLIYINYIENNQSI